jgi:hypothetical protein
MSDSYQNAPVPADGHDDADAEQLGPDDPDPRGEHREDDAGGFLTGYSTVAQRQQRADPAVVPTSVHDPPANIDRYWQQYVKSFALVRGALQLFDQAVIEPGYQITTEIDGETDDEMQDALDTWASQCVIHAGETGHDLSVMLRQCPSKRRGRGTVLIEQVGTESAPETIAALMFLSPGTFRMYTREDQNILVQPDDPVSADHPRTPRDEAAAYVQYDEDLPTSYDKDPIPFAQDDLLKLVYDPDEGATWGTSIFEAIGDRIDSLLRKMRDRDVAIRHTGHPWRVISSDTWSENQANEYAKKHRTGEMSAREAPEDDDITSFAGRVDFVPHDVVNIETHTGDVADITDAVMDDVQQIFSVLPISRFKLAYEEGINQFVVEPQQDKDARLVDDERRYLERKFEPVIEAKADELAGGSYEGDIDFSIEQPKAENPLKRDDFDVERFERFMNAFATFAQSGADALFPRELAFFAANMDPDQFADEMGLEDALPDDEAMTDPEAMQEAADALGIGGGGGSDDDGGGNQPPDENADDEDDAA